MVVTCAKLRTLLFGSCLVFAALGPHAVLGKGGSSGGKSSGGRSTTSRTTTTRRTGYSSSGARSCGSCYYSSSGGVYHRSFYFYYVPCYGCGSHRAYCHSCNTRASYNKNTYTVSIVKTTFDIQFENNADTATKLNSTSDAHRRWADHFTVAVTGGANDVLAGTKPPLKTITKDNVLLSFYTNGAGSGAPPNATSANRTNKSNISGTRCTYCNNRQAQAVVSVMSFPGVAPTAINVRDALARLCVSNHAKISVNGSYKVLKCSSAVTIETRALNATLTSYDDPGDSGGISLTSIGLIILSTIFFCYLIYMFRKRTYDNWNSYDDDVSYDVSTTTTTTTTTTDNDTTGNPVCSPSVVNAVAVPHPAAVVAATVAIGGEHAVDAVVASVVLPPAYTSGAQSMGEGAPPGYGAPGGFRADDDVVEDAPPSYAAPSSNPPPPAYTGPPAYADGHVVDDFAEDDFEDDQVTVVLDTGSAPDMPQAPPAYQASGAPPPAY